MVTKSKAQSRPSRPRKKQTELDPGATGSRDAVMHRHLPQFEIGMLGGNLGYAMRRAQLAMYAPMKAELEANNMTPQRYTALGLIGAREELSQADLGYMLGIARSGAMSIVTALESLGCVTRRRDPLDKRSYLVSLTPHGQRIVDRLHASLTMLDRRGAERLTEREREQLMAMLQRLADPYDY